MSAVHDLGLRVVAAVERWPGACSCFRIIAGNQEGAPRVGMDAPSAEGMDGQGRGTIQCAGKQVRRLIGIGLSLLQQVNVVLPLREPSSRDRRHG